MQVIEQYIRIMSASGEPATLGKQIIHKEDNRAQQCREKQGGRAEHCQWLTDNSEEKVKNTEQHADRPCQISTEQQCKLQNQVQGVC